MQIEEGSFKNPKNLDLRYRLMLPYEKETGNVEKFPHKFPVVVLVHGFGGTINSFYIKRSLAKITECGAAAFSFNLTNLHPTHVDTSELTPENALADLRTAMQFIKNHPRIDADRIIAIGASFGAYTLMRYEAEAQDEAIRAMVMYSAVPVPLKPFNKLMTPAKLRFWRLLGHIAQDIDGFRCRISYRVYEECSRIDILRDVAPKIRKPVTLIHGDIDELTSVEDLHDLRAALTASPEVQMHILPGARHEFCYIPRHNHLYSEFEQAVMHVQGLIRNLFREETERDTLVQAASPGLRRRLAEWLGREA